MAEQKFVRIDNIKWWVVTDDNNVRTPTPICPQHDMRLRPVEITYVNKYGHSLPSTDKSLQLACAEGPHTFKLLRQYSDEKKYVIDKIDSKIFSSQSFVTLDDEVIPVAREKLKDSPYWVDAKVTKSKSGTRLIIWAGNREAHNKTQLFAESDLKRLSFDQNDTHPNEVFTIVEAKFDDGSSATISKSG